ncbi:MAG: Stf0 family sulfotransferase [Pseudomonadota bacterium]
MTVTETPTSVLGADFVDSDFDEPVAHIPRHLILIYSTPRTGSTMVCDLIRRTGACVPHEYLQNFQYRPALEARWRVSPGDDAAYARALIRHRTGPAGHLGINLHARHLDSWRRFKDHLPPFERVTHLRVTREDRDAQAVSYFLAKGTGSWNTSFGDPVQQPSYDARRIHKLERRLDRDEQVLDRYLSGIAAPVATFTYERVISDPSSVPAAVEGLPGVRQAEGVAPQSDPVKRLYLSRYRRRHRLPSIVLGRLPRLVCFPKSRDNPYQTLLYKAFPNIADVDYLMPSRILKDLQATLRGAQVAHVHWEEGVFWGAKSEAEAAARAALVLRCLDRFASRGGRIVWTVHNAEVRTCAECLPHARDLRGFLAARADAVHAHSKAGVNLAVGELGVPPDRIILVPHPSYAGHYATAEASTPEPHALKTAPRRFLFFGTLKEYKGFDELLQAFVDPRVLASKATLTIAGKGTPEQRRRIEHVLEPMGRRLQFDLNPVEDDMVARHFRAADFLVQPYRETLSSGIAALAMTFALPVVAPRSGGFVSSVAEPNRPLLYGPDEVLGLPKALLRAMSLPAGDYSVLTAAARRMALTRSPMRVSAQLLQALGDRSFL